jgi:hypothetical protein
VQVVVQVQAPIQDDRPATHHRGRRGFGTLVAPVPPSAVLVKPFMRVGRSMSGITDAR